MKFTVDNTALVVIDVQGKLAQSVVDSTEIISNCEKAIKVSRALGIPIILTEQAPEKIGATIDSIKSLIPNVKPYSKTSFSCLQDSQIFSSLKDLNRNQLILCGIETHVCVFQTAIDCLKNNFEVQIISDAVSSRERSNKTIALSRLNKTKAEITSTEMLITELLQSSAHPKFKEIMQLIK